jgi:hypothetical protein
MEGPPPSGLARDCVTQRSAHYFRMLMPRSSTSRTVALVFSALVVGAAADTSISIQNNRALLVRPGASRLARPQNPRASTCARARCREGDAAWLGAEKSDGARVTGDGGVAGCVLARHPSVDHRNPAGCSTVEAWGGGWGQSGGWTRAGEAVHCAPRHGRSFSRRRSRLDGWRPGAHFSLKRCWCSK